MMAESQGKSAPVIYHCKRCGHVVNEIKLQGMSPVCPKCGKLVIISVN
ncbi:MAG: hypothetical protein KKG59_00120 [Nanoarchaeota archaeon]|nr:hypothetical protein [Nanoarchaeota archaeon]